MIPRLLLCLIVASLLLPAVSAGTQEDPELADAGDDASVSRSCDPGTPNLCDQASGGEASPSGTAEIVAAWITEPNATHYILHIQTAAAGDDATVFDISYNVTPTDISLFTGQPEHNVTFQITGTTLGDGAPANTTVARNADDDTVLEVSLTRNDTAAVGGDAITRLAVAATHTGSGSTGPVSWTDTTTDSAPDEGTSRQYNLTRPPIVADLELEAVGGRFTETIDGNETTIGFADTQANLASGDATVAFDLVLTNAGTDPDTVSLEVFDPSGTLASKNITASVSPDTATLLPGESIDFIFTAVLEGSPDGEHILLVSAESERGGAAAAALSVQVPAPPAPAPPPTQPPPADPQEDEERSPVAGLGFLTPMAEALGLDGPFGEWAELVLLALLLLLVILIVFLVLFLLGRRMVSIDVEPHSIAARPGETAEFTLRVRNRKNRHLDAVAQFDGDPHWSTAMAFGDAELEQPHTDARLGLGPKGAQSGTRTGTLRVRIPDTAGEKETDRITLGVAALDAAGRPTKRQEATVRVRARDSAVAAGLPLRLSTVDHDPADPAVGDKVTTTARLENDSEDETLRLRVVLNLDGKDLQEQPVVLPARSARAVVFRWQVPAGSSKVRVRVFPAQE